MSAKCDHMSWGTSLQVAVPVLYPCSYKQAINVSKIESITLLVNENSSRKRVGFKWIFYKLFWLDVSSIQ